MTVNAAHAKVADAFLRDLAAAVAAARRPSLRRTRVALTVGLARAAARVLPAPLMRLLTTRAGGPGARLPSRTAAMYGMMGFAAQPRRHPRGRARSGRVVHPPAGLAPT
ncbi:MAG: hypothetical protein IPO81_27375 [Kouleothrix sp.]|nr:hypothetical protein [Kouleothrix sp.]